MPTDRAHRDLPLALVVSFLAGAALAVQSRVNGTLAGSVGPFLAGWSSFGSGLALLSLGLLVPAYRRRVARIPQAVRDGRLARWQTLGGVVGGLLVATQTYAVPLVGVAAFLIAVVGGQVVSGLLVDHAGLGPGASRRISPARVVAAVLAVAGVAVAVSDSSGSTALALVPVVIAFVVGLGSGVQQATNGLVTMVTRDATATAWLNFAVGTATLVVIGIVPVIQTGLHLPTGQPAPWWSWAGGLLGIAYITMAAWAVQHSGVLLFGLVNLPGQLLTAVALDLAVPATRDRVGSQLLAGVTLTVLAAAGAAVAGRRPRSPS